MDKFTKVAIERIAHFLQPGRFPPDFEQEIGQWKNVEHSHRLIHIHVPKTGGSTVNKVLKHLNVETYGDGVHYTCHRPTPCILGHIYARDTRSAESRVDHLRAVSYCHLEPSDHSRVGTYEKAIKFAMIRNPYVMLLSEFHYQGEKGDLTWGQGISTFEDWIKKWCDPDFPWRDPHRRKFMFHQLFKQDTTPGVHYVIRTERFEEGLEKLLHAAGILEPDMRVKDLPISRGKVSPQMIDPMTDKRRNWQDFYTQEMKELVRLKCEPELTAFGYDFNGPSDDRVLFKPNYMRYRRDADDRHDGNNLIVDAGEAGWTSNWYIGCS